MDIEKTVDSIMKRANQLAPNSNFKIDGFESVKFRNVVQALVEELAQAAPEVAKVQPLAVPEGWRELSAQIVEALGIFTYHDSHANLRHKYGAEWWVKVDAMREQLSGMLAAAPSAPEVASVSEQKQDWNWKARQEHAAIADAFDAGYLPEGFVPKSSEIEEIISKFAEALRDERFRANSEQHMKKVAWEDVKYWKEQIASVPDAGDEPVYWSVTYQGQHTANAFRTKESAQATMDRLNTAYPDEDDSRKIVPLYTRPQPAPAVLDILDPRKWDEATSKAWHEAIPDMHKAFAALRAVLSAAAK